VALAELIELGDVSLRNSVDDFNFRTDIRFMHYAAMRIRYSLLSFIANKAGIGAVSVKDLEFMEIIPETHAELKTELGRDPSKVELANEMNIAIDVLQKLLQVPGLDDLSFFKST
jgi:DNA-directed RNA polymerase sigma subunit (sigma70/sigma32)